MPDPTLFRRCPQGLLSCGAVLLALALPWPAQAQQRDDRVRPDRPDFVESSDTVGKGRLQIETGVEFERDSSRGDREYTLRAPLLLRTGISNTMELRLSTDGRSFRRTEDTDTGAVARAAGYGDLTLGLKWRLKEERGKRPAFSLLFDTQFDSGSSEFRENGIQPGVRLITEWDLPYEFALRAMPGLRYQVNDEGGRFVGGILGLEIEKTWRERLHTYVELAAPQIARADNGGSKISLGAGMAYMLTRSWQVDLGLRAGINRNTPERFVTVGVAGRL